jgi:hypothetical protein
MTTNPFDLFPYPELTLLSTDRKPHLQDVRLLRRQINANAMAISSPRGGGAHGHLSICMPPADYLALTGVAWDVPAHPGPAPLIPAGSTGPQITEINRQYKADLDEFVLLKATEAALRKCLITAIPSTYIDILADDIFEYANVSPAAIIAHMQTTYGQITLDDLADNMTDLKRPWHPDQPLEDLWKQLRRCQAFALPHDPISDATTIREAIINLENSGVFIDALKEWRRRAPDTQTFANLHVDFNRADKERRRQLTTRDSGYANLATNKENTPTFVVASKSPGTMPPTTTTATGLFYCWSHGLGRNPKHTSATCSNKATGHCLDATLYNMKGGNNRIHRIQNERAVFQPTHRPTRLTANSAATTSVGAPPSTLPPHHT